jgi:AsmA protein
MRGLKIAGWALLGVVVLFVLGAIAVVSFVDPNDYKDDIAKAVKDRTGRDLKLEGQLSLSIFPWLAIETGRAELGNPPTFGAGPFVAVESADVGVKLIPLLRGQFEVRRLRLDGLRVNLVKDAHGHTNWQDLTKSSGTGSAEGSTTSASIAGLTIKDAALDYRDLGAGSHWRLLDLNASTGALGGKEPFDLDLAATVDEGEGSAAKKIKLKTRATLDTQSKRYGAKDLTLDVVLVPADKKGKQRELKLSIPSLAADLNQQTLAAPQFSLRAAGADLDGSLNGEKIVDRPQFSGTLKLPALSPRDLLKELGQEVPKTRDPKALSSLAFDAGFKATDTSAMLENLKLTLDDTHITGRAGIEDLESNALAFDLTIDQLDLDRYQAPQDKKPAQKAAKAQSEPFKLPMDTLKALNARGTVAIGTLTMAGMRMSAVKLTVDARDGLVRLNPAQAKLYGGAERGNIVVDARGDIARVSIEQRMSGVQVAPLFADLFDTRRLSGAGAVNAVLAARGNDSDALMRSLDGRLDFELANGALEGTDLWYELRRARALWKREAAPASGNSGRTAFKTLQGTGTIEKGVLSNRDLQVDMDYLKASGEGTFNLVSQDVDYKLKTSLYRIPEEGAGSEMKDLKAAEIPVRVTGTLGDPKIRPDTDALAKAEVNKQLEAKKQDLTDKLKGKLDKWLGGSKKP